MKILHIDSSARTEGSITRQLTAKTAAQLGGDVTYRDLTTSLPHVTGDWIGANFTPADQRDTDQVEILSQSDALVDELAEADVVVIGAPIYNFGVPAALKAWVDLIARAGRTFRYTENGPVGLLEGKRAVVVMASGGTKVGSDIDFASGYLRHVLGFLGIKDVEIVAADQMAIDAEGSIAAATAAVEKLAA